MTLQMGQYNQLEVLRITDYAYILGDSKQEAFLHKRQATKTLEVGEVVRVFLYYDNQKRITATMNEPLIDMNKAAFVEVVDAKFNLGAFLDIGLQKDLLLSKDDLPFMKNEWPEQGDKVFASIKTSKNQLTAKLISRYDIQQYLSPIEPLVEGQTVTAYNVYKAEEGNVFFTEQGHYIFVYFKHMRKVYRLGEQAEIKIILKKDINDYNGTITLQKELMISKDGEKILAFLDSHGGVMPYTDQSTPEEIMDVFHMSKGAFKRAIGTLYKSKLIELNDNETRRINS
jgi:predicted RNA-binding protein (virulence factor B family)